jgi:dephospho-CoA kinase
MTKDSDPSHLRRIPVIGVIGGIGSGKSAVARWVAGQLNIPVIDADDLGHQVLRAAPVKSALRNRFGDQIFDEHDEVQRGQLARRIFGEGDLHRTARTDLERIVHPAIESRIADAIMDADKQHKAAVLLDAAILLEAGWQHRCDAVIFVDAPDDVRWRRVQARSGWSLEEFHRRESSQLTLEDKKRRSDAVISNAADDQRGGEELLDFLCSRWSICCKLSPNSSKQSETSSEFLPP